MDAPRTCVVSAPTRLHIGLLDCSDATPRRFGGVGIALAKPEIRLQASIGEAAHSKVIGLNDDDLAEAVLGAIRAVTAEGPAVLVEFEPLPPRHVGLGTGTAARLAAAAGAAHVTDRQISIEELAVLCGRGGTSGIGVNAFAAGGMIFDGGRVVDGSESFAPSRYRAPRRVPPIITRLTLPPHWKVSLLVPRAEPISGADELAFFGHELPLHPHESLQALGYAYHGVAPAVIEGDLPALGRAIRKLHSVGFKARELARQSDEVQALLKRLQANEALAAGMSSFGPLIYAITDMHDRATNEYVHAAAVSAGLELIPSQPADSGHRIEPQAHGQH